jgi:hypothetical protein
MADQLAEQQFVGQRTLDPLSWISRAIGRAPIIGSKPCWASQSRAAGVADS